MRDLDELKRQFSGASEFADSPLYTALAPIVAREDTLLQLAAQARRGQYPTFLFFAAVHDFLLGGVSHELAEFYPSIVGTTARPPAAGAGPALVSFCAEHEAALRLLLETRLVQTNSVPRSLALRLAFVALRERENRPIHLVEIGASAGIHLRFDRFGYRLGERQFGDPASPVQIEAELVGQFSPDLDAVAALASATGIDLNPLDVTDVGDRRWLDALVWPDNQRERDLLRPALEVVRDDPPTIHRGDVRDLCPALSAELPSGEPRLVFSVATRMHVQESELPAFDAAIDTLGENGPLYVLSLDREPDPDPRLEPARRGGAIILRAPDGIESLLGVAGWRLDWIEPIEN